MCRLLRRQPKPRQCRTPLGQWPRAGYATLKATGWISPNTAGRFKAMDVECLSVVTNKPPTGPYRGAGGPEGAFFMERTIALLARELALDPAEIRRRNFIV